MDGTSALRRFGRGASFSSILDLCVFSQRLHLLIVSTVRHVRITVQTRIYRMLYYQSGSTF